MNEERIRAELEQCDVSIASLEDTRVRCVDGIEVQKFVKQGFLVLYEKEHGKYNAQIHDTKGKPDPDKKVN